MSINRDHLLTQFCICNVKFCLCLFFLALLLQHKPPFHVDDLIEGLQDGTRLLALLEVLSGERLVSFSTINLNVG